MSPNLDLRDLDCGLVGCGRKEGMKMFYLTTNKIHFIYGYMTRTILMAGEETSCLISSKGSFIQLHQS